MLNRVILFKAKSTFPECSLICSPPPAAKPLNIASESRKTAKNVAGHSEICIFVDAYAKFGSETRSRVELYAKIRIATLRKQSKSQTNTCNRYLRCVKLNQRISCALSGHAAAEWAKPSRSGAALRRHAVLDNPHGFSAQISLRMW